MNIQHSTTSPHIYELHIYQIKYFQTLSLVACGRLFVEKVLKFIMNVIISQ